MDVPTIAPIPRSCAIQAERRGGILDAGMADDDVPSSTDDDVRDDPRRCCWMSMPSSSLVSADNFLGYLLLPDSLMYGP